MQCRFSQAREHVPQPFDSLANAFFLPRHRDCHCRPAITRIANAAFDIIAIDGRDLGVEATKA